MRELHSHFGAVAAVVPQVLSATDTSSAIDLRGFDSATLVISTGAIVSAGNFTAKLQHSSTTTAEDFVDVPAADLIGALPSALAASTVYRQGYVGGKRYVRTVISKNSGTSIAASAVIVKGHPAISPVA